METVYYEQNASVLYTTKDGEDYEQTKTNLIDPDQWMNSTNNLNGAECYHICHTYLHKKNYLNNNISML